MAIRFERCVRKVKARQPKKCARLKWKRSLGCVNPWAVCHSRIK